MSLTSIRERTFTQDVLESPTPVLVHFWAPWCGLCRLINPLLTRFQGEWGEQFKVVSFNADESLKVANTYRLTTLPTLILFEGGKVQHRIDGFHGREELWKSLEMMASLYGESNKTLWLQPQQKRHPFSA